MTHILNFVYKEQILEIQSDTYFVTFDKNFPVNLNSITDPTVVSILFGTDEHKPTDTTWEQNVTVTEILGM